MNFKNIINLIRLHDEDRKHREQILELLKEELNKLNDDYVQEIEVLRRESGINVTMLKKYSNNTYDIKIKYSNVTNKVYVSIDNKYYLELAG